MKNVWGRVSLKFAGTVKNFKSPVLRGRREGGRGGAGSDKIGIRARKIVHSEAHPLTEEECFDNSSQGCRTEKIWPRPSQEAQDFSSSNSQMIDIFYKIEIVENVERCL